MPHTKQKPNLKRKHHQISQPTDWQPHRNDTERRQQRANALTGYGVGTREDDDHRPFKRRKPSESKRNYLGRFRDELPGFSQQQRMQLLPVSGIKYKGDPSIAGDHSPAISTVNKVKSREFGISGRSSFQGGYTQSMGENDIPTFQFDTPEFQHDNGRRSDRGASAHSYLTTLRDMNHAGEADRFDDMASLLDATEQAYSPYDARGDIQLPDHAPPKSHIHPPGKPDQRLTSHGVQPFIGQKIINKWYKDQLG